MRTIADRLDDARWVLAVDGVEECYEQHFFNAQIAGEWLGSMALDRQRPIKNWQVRRLAATMRRGTFDPKPLEVGIVPGLDGWHPTVPGWGTQVGGRAYLIDGQHRLKAVIEADARIEMPVRWRRCEDEGRIRELYARTDRGASRSITDGLRVHRMNDLLGVSESFAARMAGAMPFLLTGFGTHHARSTVSFDLETRILELQNWRTEIQAYEICLTGVSRGFGKRLTRGAIAAVALVTLHSQRERAVGFWRAVASQDGLAAGTPEQTLVRFLYESSERKLDDDYAARAVAVAWNAAFRRKTVTLLRVVDPRAPIQIAGSPYTGK